MSTRLAPRSLALNAVVAIMVLAGCSTAPSATTSLPPANPPTATPLATRPSMDPELEAVLPDSVGQLRIAKSSLAGLSFAESVNPAFRQFVQDIGVSGAAISVASGVGESTSSPEAGIFLLAVRIRGASEEQIVSTFRRALESSTEQPFSVTTTTIAGKEVQAALPQGTDEQPAYFYARGDVMLFVAASDQALAEEAITLLP